MVPSLALCVFIVGIVPAPFFRRISSDMGQREANEKTIANMKSEKPASVLAQQLLALDICQITPLQALSLLHDLQQQARMLVGKREVST